MRKDMDTIHIRLPGWMKKRFLSVTKNGERSRIIRKKIMEIIMYREAVVKEMGTNEWCTQESTEVGQLCNDS